MKWIPVTLIFALTSVCIAQELPVPSGANDSEQAIQARHALLELQSQLRIAQSKLTEDGLDRKLEIGRHRALLGIVNSQMRTTAAQVQRGEQSLKEMENRLGALQDGFESGGRNSSRIETLIQRIESRQASGRQLLDRLARQRTHLEEKIETLKAEHLLELLDAASDHEVPQLEISTIDFVDRQLSEPASDVERDE